MVNVNRVGKVKCDYQRSVFIFSRLGFVRCQSANRCLFIDKACHPDKYHLCSLCSRLASQQDDGPFSFIQPPTLESRTYKSFVTLVGQAQTAFCSIDLIWLSSSLCFFLVVSIKKEYFLYHRRRLFDLILILFEVFYFKSNASLCSLTFRSYSF